MGLFSKKEEVNPLENKTEEDLYGKQSLDDAIESLEGDLNKKNNPLVERKKEILEKEVDIRRYKDPEGLTVQKMKIGLWLVEKRKFMRGIVYGVLIVISGVTWFNFFFTFGNYLLFGIREDQLLLRGMVETTVVNHQYLIERSANEMKISNVQIFKNDDKYDFLVQLDNVNDYFWGRFDYYFVSNNKEFGHAEGFILPGEKKFVVALGHDLGFLPSNVKVNIENLFWTRVNKHKYPNWNDFRDTHLNFKINDVVFTPAKETLLTEKLNLSDLHFTVNNDTPYNYWAVNFIILLKGQSGKVVAVNKYILENVMSENIYDIGVTWSGDIAGVKDVLILPDVDITRNDIYIDF